MKQQSIIIIIALAILPSCNSFKTKITHTGDTCFGINHCSGNEVAYTNTSKSKYLEVTIKVTSSDYTPWTTTVKLRPGEIEHDCECPGWKFSIVGEREIADDD